jgi:hypothetical protein
VSVCASTVYETMAPFWINGVQSPLWSGDCNFRLFPSSCAINYIVRRSTLCINTSRWNTLSNAKYILLEIGEFLYVCVSVCLSVRLYVSTFLNGSSPNWEGTSYGSWHVAWAIYSACANNARAKCARMCAFAYFWTDYVQFAENILRLTISGKDYVLFIFTHSPRTRVRACVCESACD